MRVDLSKEFKEKYQKLLGDRAEKIFQAIQADSIDAFRLNPLKDDFKNVKVSLDAPIPYSNVGYYGSIDGKQIDHIAGYLYSQEPSAMYVAELVAPEKSDRILDLCAAPGSKSTYLATLMDPQDILVSNEINHQRAKVLSSNIERMGITNTIVTNNSPQEFEKGFNEYFDKILVDAPCSGEGMFRKDPESVKYWSPEYVEQCANRQRHILDSAYKLLKPGGRLVYSTCTFSPEENEANIEYLLKTYPDMKLNEVKKYPGMEDGVPAWGNNDPELKKALRMFPDNFKGEGHFMCQLQKSGAESKLRIKQLKQNLKKPDLELLKKFAQTNLEVLPQDNLLRVKDFLYQAASLDSRFSSLHVMRNGLNIGEFKKNRLEPDIAMVLATQASDLKAIYNLSDEEYKKYLHGESVILDTQPDFSNKWIGLSYQNKLFSWGRYSNKQIKNVYPKGLRR